MKNSTFYIVVLFVMAMTMNGYSQSATIAGNIINGNGLVIRVLSEPNPFTLQREVLATDTCDASGNFKFTLTLYHPIQACIDVWFQRDYFWIAPSDSLTLKALTPVSKSATALRGEIGFIPTVTDTSLLAYQIDRYDNDEANFLDTSFNAIFKKGDLNLARNFIDQQTAAAKVTKTPFVAAYMKYSLMQLSLESRVTTPESISENLFKSRPDYQNGAFMSLASTLFNDIYQKSKSLNTKAINESALNGQYHKFIDLLGADSMLVNEIVRELAAMRIITNIVHSVAPSKRRMAVSLLDSLATNTKFNEHKILAQQTSKQLKAFLPGQPAPPLLSTDSLFPDTLRGKPVVIMFMHTQCPACIEAAEWLAAFTERENWRGYVVSIFVDENAIDFETFHRQQSWPWQSIWGGNDVNMADRWNIRSLPFTVFVDREGKISSYPAPEPSVESEKILLKLAEIKRVDRRRK